MMRCLLALLILLVSGVAAAQGDHEDVGDTDKAIAREMFARGDQAYRDGRFDAAFGEFLGADTIMRVPTTALEVGRALVALGRLKDAIPYLERAASDEVDAYEPQAFTDARREGRRLLREVKERVAHVTIVLDGSEADVTTTTIDGTEVRPAQLGEPYVVDPGDHTLKVDVRGLETRTRTFSVKEGETRTLSVTLGPQSADEESTVATTAEGDTVWWPYLALGVGGASLIAGAVSGALSLSKASDFQERCDETTRACPPDAEGEADEARTLAHASTATFIIGGAGVALGAVGLVVTMMDDDASVDAALSLTGATLRVRF